MEQMSGLENVWDWSFFWGTFGFILKVVAAFVMLVVAIHSVGLLLKAVITAIRSR
jgi:hypothetical protein